MKSLLTALLAAIVLCGTPHQAGAQSYRREALSFGVNFGVNVAGEELAPKYTEYAMHPYGTLQVSYFPLKEVFLRADVFAGTLGAKLTKTFLLQERFRTVEIVSYETWYGGTSVGAGYVFPELWRIRPLANARIGMLVHKTSMRGVKGYENNFTEPALIFGAGLALEYVVDHNLTMRVGYDLMLTSTDRLDGIPTGRQNDALSLFTAGFSWVIRPGKADAEEMLRDPYGEGAGSPSGGVEGMREADLEQLPAEQTDELPSTALFAAEVDDNMLGLHTVLNAAPIGSVDDLRADPTAFELTVRQARDQALPLQASLELSRGGTLLLRASGSMLLDGKVTTFDASEFLDLATAQRMNGFSGQLPQGNYAVRVVTESERDAVASIALAGFLNVDLRPIFGSRTEDARERIKEQSVDLSLDEDEALVVNLFAPSGRRHLSEGEMLAMQTGEEREPVRITPPGSGYDQQREYVATQVQHSVMESLTLQELARHDGRPSMLRTAVAEVFFPLDDASLNDEARLVLDYVALHLNRHPELQAELRGYANDIGDETTNALLAKRRADRVLEYLVRRQMDNYRLSAKAMPRDVEGINLSNDPRRGRRVDIVLHAVKR